MKASLLILLFFLNSICLAETSKEEPNIKRNSNNPIGITSEVLTEVLIDTSVEISAEISVNISTEISNQRKKAFTFIYHSYDEILVDSAKGDGKYIQALATLSGKSIQELRNITLILVADNSYNAQTKMQKSGKLYNLVM